MRYTKSLSWPVWLWSQLIRCTQVIYVGIVVGTVVGMFRIAESNVGTWVVGHLALWREHMWILPLYFGGLVLLAWVIGLLVRYCPDISGSGIPQVELTLYEGFPLRWTRVLWAKFVGSWLAIAGGLSLGREGPCIHMGAAVGAGVSQMWNMWEQDEQKHSALITAGAAAGLGAAFSAPLAGLIFVFEEMRCPFRPGLVGLVVLTVSTTHVFMTLVFDLKPILPFTNLIPPAMESYGLLAPFALLVGLAGVVYTRLLLWLKDREARQKLLPASLRTLPTLCCAGVLAFVCPQVLGGGDNLLFSLGNFGWTVRLLCLLCLLKMLFSLYSYTGGVPGGLLMPMLCIGGLGGACAGHLLAQWQWINPQEAHAYILLGMVGYFAAIVRAPLTGTALTLEMTTAWHMAPACLLVAFVACMVANSTNTEPVYVQLKQRVRRTMDFSIRPLSQ